ncbi:hypothetical protein QA601_15820 [Chitinispirillales bacterium ANBcel5]|uniref:THUMP domain-containing class I SAM-dependent RNA methyltransferase n=1 Tax=Cellulosispirillum alkaliphilum TaxID=3039283 RepID=UPI002A565215|nr:hypothetical protein [Chitinispirillales bacterium ANBcel5]
MSKASIVVTVPRGLCRFLREEVEQLGYPVRSLSSTTLETEGNKVDAMRLNLHLRTAHHVLYEVAKFKARNADELYKSLLTIPWELMIPADGYLSVVSNVVNTTIRDTRFANLRCKDAIVDRIFQRKGRRPDSGSDRTRAVVSLFWRDDRCRVYLDTSGEPLSRRGYRKIPLSAPMQETLAAGVIKASGWNYNEHFVNPMCGSATIAIEAALAASERAPGLTRVNFGFLHLLGFDRYEWQKLRKQAGLSVKKRLSEPIIATDVSEKAIEAAQKNAQTAGVSNLIRFYQRDFSETIIPPEPGVIVVNPEYGIRMGKEDELITTYRDIGSFFKHKCQGYRGYIFTANTTLAGKVGLKAKRHYPFFNGKIECRLYEYELYRGTRVKN